VGTIWQDDARRLDLTGLFGMEKMMIEASRMPGKTPWKQIGGKRA
jgi:hypothetical protein